MTNLSTSVSKKTSRRTEVVLHTCPMSHKFALLKNKLLLLTCILLLLTTCVGSEDKGLVNTAPTKPALNTPTNAATNIVPNSKLVWQASRDADKDPITYDVYLSVENPPTRKISAGQTATDYTPTAQTFDTKYYWQVVAKDGKGETKSDIWSYTTQANKGSGSSAIDVKTEEAHHKRFGLIFRYKANSAKAILDKEFTYDKQIYFQVSKETAQKLADRYTTLIPTSSRKAGLYLYLFTGTPESAPNGFAARLDEDSVEPLGIYMNYMTYIFDIDSKGEAKALSQFDETLIHEFGHVLSLDASQVTTWDQNFQCPPGHFSFSSNECFKPDSYLYTFRQTFWTQDILDAFAKETKDGDSTFYVKRKDQFVSGYAASNFAEDFAETFLYFVKMDKPTADKISNRKILFMYNYSKLVALRRDIRAKMN